jgi:DivIVA domain-containing protein
VPAEIRDGSFTVAVRGYERRAVDTYIERVNRVIADLEVERSEHWPHATTFASFQATS